MDNWHKSKEKQKCHSLFDCQACHKSANLKSVLSIFTNLHNKYEVKAKNKGLFDNVKLNEQANDILNDLNKDYREKYKTKFTKQELWLVMLVNRNVFSELSLALFSSRRLPTPRISPVPTIWERKII